MTTIGERLRDLRGTLSEAEVGRRLGKSQMWVSRRETGEARTSVEDAQAIAEALGYTAELVIAPRSEGSLYTAAVEAGADYTAIAIRVLRALPHVSGELRRMFIGVLEQLESEVELRQAEERRRRRQRRT